MRQRGESAEQPANNKDGELVLSPIAHWNSDDVWETIALYGGGGRPGRSDFEETKRLYARRKCGARLGCHVCQMAEDKSLSNMIAYDERYAYAAGLQRLNQFIRNTRFDRSRRHWIGRIIRAGFIKLDTYHPSMVRELFRYMLQLDFDEQVRAAAAGERPRFELLPPGDDRGD